MTYIQDAALEELKRRIAMAGTQRAAALELGVSESDITNAIKGYRPMTETLLNALGYTRITAAVPTGQVNRITKVIKDHT